MLDFQLLLMLRVSLCHLPVKTPVSILTNLYTSSVDIEARIDGLGLLLDIDGNSQIDPLSDGLLILRYLFGLQGATLIADVVATDATRTTAADIEAYLAKMAPNI